MRIIEAKVSKRGGLAVRQLLGGQKTSLATISNSLHVSLKKVQMLFDMKQKKKPKCTHTAYARHSRFLCNTWIG